MCEFKLKIMVVSKPRSRSNNVFQSLIFLLIIGGMTFESKAQFTPPYYNGFDSVQDTVGWSHYALGGNDDWEWGVPEGLYLNATVSAPYCWGTNLDGERTENSIMCLETPSFDLSGPDEYVLAIAHQYHTYNGGGNIDYSLDGGTTWVLLDGNTNQQVNWYTANQWYLNEDAWYGSYTNSFRFSAHLLTFLQGQTDVKFRFKFGGGHSPREGWVIDDFRIIRNNPNVVALDGITYNASKYFSSFTIDVPIFYNAFVSTSFSNVTEYYFSYDNVFDGSDQLIGTKSINMGNSISSYQKTFPMMPNLSYGDYYIFVKHDADNNLVEADETDNVAKCILHIDSTFIPDYREDFESAQDWWTSYSTLVTVEPWVKGNNQVHQIYGTHSGDNAYYIPDPPVVSNNAGLYLESPYLDFSGPTGDVICLWYKSFDNYPEMYNVGLESRADTAYIFTSSNGLTYDTIPTTRVDDWDCICHDLNHLDGQNNTKLRLLFSSLANNASTSHHEVVDDIYIGEPRPDISLEHLHQRTLNANWIHDTLYYNVFNSGLAPASSTQTEFYWSTDSVLDPSDILLGSKIEPSLVDTSYSYQWFAFTLPTNTEGDYYIISQADVNDVLDEMWESNNTSVFPTRVTPALSLPYSNDFETQIDHWYHQSLFGSDNWEWTTPNGFIVNSAFSGQKGLVTKADGIPDSSSLMLLYTPMFNLTGLTNPVMQFDMIYDVYHDGNPTDEIPSMNMSYSIDNGANWIILDTASLSYTNWYYEKKQATYYGFEQPDYTFYTDHLFHYRENTFSEIESFQGRDVKRNTHYNLDLAHLQHHERIQFRFNFATPREIGAEGAVIDDFKISEAETDLLVTYEKELMISSVSNEVRFFMHISNTRNYMSSPCVAKFYLSLDTILDAGDYYLGEDSIPVIRPHTAFYLNTVFDSPQFGLDNYVYLLYQLDATNTTTEVDEVNNIGHWPLEVNGVSDFPYYESFNDTVVDGWHHYITLSNGHHLRDGFRVRNMIAPGEDFYQMDLNSGTMFTERVNNVWSDNSLPYWYLESPAFDFTGLDSIHLSFQLMCVGRENSNDSEGGNIMVSINGGNSWFPLTHLNADTINWFNIEEVETLDNEPGWGFNPPGSGVEVLDSTAMDISWLSGYPHVQFRFKYRSNHEFNTGYDVQGLRVDDFRVFASPSVPVGANSPLNGSRKVLIYPNPTTDQLTMEFSSEVENGTYQLIDIKGKIVDSGMINGQHQITLNLPEESGIYVVKATTNETSFVERVVKH